MPPPPADPSNPPPAEDHNRAMLIEVRELLIEIRRAQGDERAGAREDGIRRNNERLITLEKAAALIWGESAGRKTDGWSFYVGTLKLFATTGMFGYVLETKSQGKKWYTSREAVERFKNWSLCPPQEERPKRGPRRRPG